MTGWTGWFDIGVNMPMDPLLMTEGIGIKDLTRPDPYYVLPLTLGFLGILNTETRPVLLIHRPS
jgi:membrane protein insertase Oxa1/YidC/SpoIIIJ